MLSGSFFYISLRSSRVVEFCSKYKYVYDREVHITYKGCNEKDTWARLDFVIYKEDHIIILSVDKFQHEDYEVLCEVARMSKVVCSIRQSGDMRRILWLRFNPDSFTVDGETKRVPMKLREKTLAKCIDSSKKLLENSPSVAIYYLYYDCFSSNQGLTAEVTINFDYAREWKELVKGCICD